MWLSRCLHPAFVRPISSRLRTAVLVPLFRDGRRVACFSEWDAERLAHWKPQILAGYLSQLIDCPAQPTHALVVVTHPGQWLSPADRDRLWKRFGVPVFHQIVDRDGTLVAAECEAHADLHVASVAAACEIGTVRRQLCACGKETELLIPGDGQRTLTVTRSESVCPSAPVATT